MANGKRQMAKVKERGKNQIAGRVAVNPAETARFGFASSIPNFDLRISSLLLPFAI
jgi:hypothetical protein